MDNARRKGSRQFRLTARHKPESCVAFIEKQTRDEMRRTTQKGVPELVMCSFFATCKVFRTIFVWTSRVFQLWASPKWAPKGGCPGEGSEHGDAGAIAVVFARAIFSIMKSFLFGPFCCEHDFSDVILRISMNTYVENVLNMEITNVIAVLTIDAAKRIHEDPNEKTAKHFQGAPDNSSRWDRWSRMSRVWSIFARMILPSGDVVYFTGIQNLINRDFDRRRWEAQMRPWGQKHRLGCWILVHFVRRNVRLSANGFLSSKIVPESFDGSNCCFVCVGVFHSHFHREKRQSMRTKRKHLA